MKKRKYLLIGAVVVTLLLSTSSSIGLLTSYKKEDKAIIEVFNYDPPGPPSGPTEGVVNVSYTYCVDLPDEVSCEPYFVIWVWGDGDMSEWLGPYKAEETVCANHSWSEPGSYAIKVGFKDGCGREYWTDPLIVNISDNRPPSTPTIKGPPKARPIYGGVGEEYEFTIRSVDPDGDNIKYIVDWGDGSWIETSYYPSGENVTLKHTWYQQGTYTVKAKAKDIHGAESDWGTMPIPIRGSKYLYQTKSKKLSNDYSKNNIPKLEIETQYNNLNKNEILNQGNNEPGMINPMWISKADDLDIYDDIRVYEDYVYVSGGEWDPEEEKVNPIVCKIDTTDGSLIWRTPLLLFEDRARVYDIQVFNQGIYVIGPLEKTTNFFLCKLDINGDISWHKIITTEKYQRLYGIATDNTYLYICGMKGLHPDQNPRIIKMDSEGNEVWDKTYKPGYVIYEIVIDNNFIYGVGSTGNPQDFVLMKIDLEGTQIWNRTCGGPEVEIASGITVKDDYVYAIGLGGYDYLVKYDKDGEFQWETNAGIHGNGNDVVIHDGYAYTTGQIYSKYTWWEVVLFKYDLESNLISYLTGPSSSSGRDLEIYDDYLYLSSFDYVLKYDMYQNPDNNKPDKPSKPTGRTNGRIWIPHAYTSMATDPDNDLISYDFSWGDGLCSFLRWYNSGESVKTYYTWREKGNYEVKVRVRDEFGLVSEWSDPLPVTMPRNRAIHSPFLRFLENHPNLFPIIRQLLGF